MNHADSFDSIVENAQQDPHCPWFLTGVIAPLAFQSTDDGFDKLDVVVSIVLECFIFGISLDKYLA